MQRWSSFVGVGVCIGVVALAACSTGDAVYDEPDLRWKAAGGVGGAKLDASPDLVVAVGAGGFMDADASPELVAAAGAGGSGATAVTVTVTVAGAGGSTTTVGAGGSGVTTGAGGSSTTAGAGGGVTTGAGGSSTTAGAGGGVTTGAGGSSTTAGAGGGVTTGAGGSGVTTGAGGGATTGAGGAAPSKLGLGVACVAGADCLSSNCIDGVCCDGVCGGSCQACTAAKKGAGVDGVCGPINAGADPDGECPSQPAASCGTTGDCNGAGACRKHSNGTVCVAASCAGGTQSNADLCDGNGTCVDGGSMACGALGCNGAICKTPCAGDADCPPTAYCDAGLCAMKLPLGSPCTAEQASRCGTGFCADGVCCDAACSGSPCVTCKQSGGAPMDGTCTARNGPACDDQDLGTPCDLCVSGVCQGTPTPSDSCQAVVYSAQRMACTVYSKLDGLPCDTAGNKGICIAGSCLPSSPAASTAQGSGGATGQGGATSAQSGQGGAGKPSGAGGDAGYGLQGGGCNVAPAPTGGAPWLLLGLLGLRRSSRSRRVRRAR